MYRSLGFWICWLGLVATFPAQEATPPAKVLGPFTLTHVLPATPVQSQDNTGTCWSFATVSFFETEAARLTGELADLSEIYPVRSCYADKLALYVEKKGKNTLGEGGLSHDLIGAIQKHGLMPASAYTGLLPGARRHNHAELVKVLKATADVFIAPNARKPSPSWTTAVSGVLDAYLGAAPKFVTIAGQEITPLQYATDVLKIDVKRYVEVMSYGTSPFGQPAKLDVPDNWMHFDQYKNVPIDDLMRGLDHAIESGYSTALDCDVSEKGFRSNRGIATLEDELEKPNAVTQEIRDRMFADKSTTDDHLMHVVGKAKHEDGRTFYYVKNSWGPVGPFQGYVFLSENYVRAKALAFMVHEDALPPLER